MTLMILKFKERVWWLGCRCVLVFVVVAMAMAAVYPLLLVLESE